MAVTLANLLQGGGSQPAVPGVKQAVGPTVQGSLLQGSAPVLQGSTVKVQGSSPALQQTITPQKLQPTVNPSTLPASTVIKVPTATPTPQPTPVPTPVPAPVDPNASAPAAPVLPDRSNSIRVNEAALAGADAQRTSGLAAIQDTLGKLFGRYGEEASGNDANYNEQSDANKGNLLRNTQAAMVNAAEGRRGLFGILSSLGALSGSGVTLANRAVQNGANADISGANDTFGENQVTLDTGIRDFRTADERRRQDAEQAAEASRQNLENQVLTTKQKTYSSLADDYSQMGNAGRAKEYADMVAALFPDIARTSVPAAAINYAGATYAPGTLNKYVAGSNGTQIQATPAAGTSLPGLVAVSPTQKKKVE